MCLKPQTTKKPLSIMVGENEGVWIPSTMLFPLPFQKSAHIMLKATSFQSSSIDSPIII